MNPTPTAGEIKRRLKDAYACAQKDEYDKAISLCNEVMSNHPSFTVEALRERAAVHRRMGRVAEAIEDMTRLIDLGSDEPNDYFTRGRYYVDNGNNLEAVADFTEAIERGSRRNFHYYTEAAYFLRAVANLRLRRYDQALADCQHVRDDYDLYIGSGLTSKAGVVREAETGRAKKT